MISYVLWYHSTNHDIIFYCMISHNVSDIINPTMISYADVKMWYHMWHHMWYGNKRFHSAASACSLAASLAAQGCLLPAVFFGLFCPSPCPADWILPGSLCLVNGHRPGLASSAAPQPEIHLVQSAAVPAIRLVICGCWSQDSAVLELVGNSRMGVAIYEAGIERGSPQYICHWAYI